MQALFTLTPAESKRLLGKAVVAMPEVQHAKNNGYLLVGRGSTNAFILEELLEKKIEKEKELLLLSSQLEFLKNLKIRYEDFPETQEVTIILQKQIPSLPSVIVARVEDSLKKDQGQNTFSIQTEAKVITQGVEQLQEKIEQNIT